jgi:hypothetical protein
MARALKQLAAMKRDPRRGWTIADVKQVCRSFGVRPYGPERGSHYVLSHPSIEGLLTIPAARPVKPMYILLVADLLECLAEAEG